jgi:hypothetical protein
MARRRQYKAVVIVPPVDGGNSWVAPTYLQVFSQSDITLTVNKLFQYKSLFEPLQGMTTPETFVGVFTQDFNTVTFKRKYQYQSRFEPLVPRAEDPTLDKWVQPISQRLHARKQIVREDIVEGFVPPATEVRFDSWFQNTSTPRFDKRRQQHTFPTFFTDVASLTQPESSHPDAWYRETARPRFDIKRNQFQYGFFVTDPFPVITSDNVTVDKWLTGDEVPSKRKDFRFTYPSFFAPIQPVASLDIPVFTQDFNLVVFKKKYQYQARVQPIFTPGTEGEITLDKWYTPIVQRHNPPKVRRQYHISDPLPDVTTFYAGVFSQSSSAIAVNKLFQYQAKFEALRDLTVAETVTLDKWFQPTQVPPKGKNKTQHTYTFSFLSSDPIGTPAIFVSTAVHQTNVPFFARKDYRRIYPALFFDATPIAPPDTAQLDKWFQPTQTPRRDGKRAPHLYPFFFPSDYPVPVTETVTLDKWFRATEVPPKGKKSQPYLFPAVFRDVKVLVPAEWIPPTQQPRFKRAERQYLYPVSVTDIRLLELLTLDKWYKEMNQPYFPRKNHSRLYPQPFMDAQFIFFPVPGGVIHGLNKDTNTIVGGRGKVDVGVNKDTGTIVGSRGKTDIGLNKDTNTIIGTRLRGKK